MIGRHAHASWRAVPLCAAAFVLAVTTGRLLAHHSHGNYDMTTYTSIKGTIKEVHWMNPHTWIYLEVKGPTGEVDVWALEGASIPQLERRGWSKEMVKVGTTITVRCHQLRDKSTGCLLGFITPEGGVEKMFD